MKMRDLPSLRGRLIVSCQAAPDSPIGTPEMIAAFAWAAVSGGAGAVRINGTADIRAVRAAVSVPVIGLSKRRVDGFSVFITPTLQDAMDVAEAGADFVAIDATLRARPDGLSVQDVIGQLRARGIRVVADVDCVEAGVQAARAGADLVASTLAGYTSGEVPTDPDVRLVRDLVSATSAPVVAEGRYNEPAQVRAAFDAGAYAVVVGQAITNPIAITHRFAAATPSGLFRDRQRDNTNPDLDDADSGGIPPAEPSSARRSSVDDAG